MNLPPVGGCASSDSDSDSESVSQAASATEWRATAAPVARPPLVPSRDCRPGWPIGRAGRPDPASSRWSVPGPEAQAARALEPERLSLSATDMHTQ